MVSIEKISRKFVQLNEYLDILDRISKTPQTNFFKELYLEEEALVTSEIIFLVEDSPEGGYEAKALDHSIFTEA